MPRDETWGIFSQDERPIILKIEINGVLEDMQYYATRESALLALNSMEDEDRIKHGAYVREVIDA